jgi:predicted Zn-dependent protease
LRLLVALLAASALLPSGCLQFRSAPKNPLAQEITVEKEREIGSQIHRQIRDAGVLLMDPVLLDYLNDLGQQIVQVTEPQPFIYRFNIIEVEGLNAFAVPGGYIYLHSETVESAGSLSELVGVLAHEVAHVRKRHIARAQEGQGLRTLATLAAIILSGGEPAVAAIASGINVSMQLKHTRDHEAEADREGIGYMIAAGYEPDGMSRFFERINTQSRSRPGEIPPYLFTHPAIPERIHASRVEIRRRQPPPGLIEDSAEFRRMQERLVALLNPVAGGSGLQARATFDRSVTEPLLDQARAAVEGEDLERARLILEGAQALEPRDPRIPLALADLDEHEGDLEQAAVHLRRAFEIDPSVPLVQYRLGVVHKRLGHRTRAVFYLEQAASNYSAGSAGRRRAEFEIESLAFPLLEASGLATKEGRPSQEFARGEPVVWWGQVSSRFEQEERELAVEWMGPSGQVAHTEKVYSDGPRVSSTLDTGSAPAGRWRVRVSFGDNRIEERSFRISEPRGAS